MHDFYKTVPKGLRENLEYRIDIGRRAEKDVGFRRSMLAAAKHDVLWWLNSWCWAFEPRPQIIDGKKQPHIVPFITWPHQDPVIRMIDEHLGFEDIGGEKSRGEGASWIVILLFLHRWLFHDLSALGMVSRNEDAADNPTDPDSLGWKLDWELSKLPKWMAGEVDKDYKRSIKDHSWVNYRNGSTIAAYSATGDVASGGRKLAFLMDELSKFPRGPDRESMASTQHVTNCRLFVSTPKGREGAYYELMHSEFAMKRFVLDWKDNPTRNRGLYTFKRGKPVAIDPKNNPLPADYNPPSPEIQQRFESLKRNGFTLEDTVRSPWYDKQCHRSLNPQQIAQELDRDYGGSMHRVFRDEFFKKADESKRQPIHRGHFVYSRENLEGDFEEDKQGELVLWCPLDSKLRPPARGYSIGVDPSFGLGGAYTNNSSLSVVDITTMEQVAEFAVHTMPPEDFAEFTIALAKWFYDAYVCFEANGPGIGYAKRFLARHYGNVYYRHDELKQTKKKQRKIGWWSSPDNKRGVIGEMSRSVKAGEVVIRSEPLVKECWQYLVINGEICNAAAVQADDVSRGQAHADRVIAFALALHGIRDRPVLSKAVVEKIQGNPEYGTLAWREKFHEKREENDGWDHRTNDDIAAGSRLT